MLEKSEEKERLIDSETVLRYFTVRSKGGKRVITFPYYCYVRTCIDYAFYSTVGTLLWILFARSLLRKSRRWSRFTVNLPVLITQITMQRRNFLFCKLQFFFLLYFVIFIEVSFNCEKLNDVKKLQYDRIISISNVSVFIQSFIWIMNLRELAISIKRVLKNGN